MVTLIIIGIWILVAVLVGLGIGRTISRADRRHRLDEPVRHERHHAVR